MHLSLTIWTSTEANHAASNGLGWISNSEAFKGGERRLDDLLFPPHVHSHLHTFFTHPLVLHPHPLSLACTCTCYTYLKYHNLIITTLTILKAKEPVKGALHVSHSVCSHFSLFSIYSRDLCPSLMLWPLFPNSFHVPLMPLTFHSFVCLSAIGCLK